MHHCSHHSLKETQLKLMYIFNLQETTKNLYVNQYSLYKFNLLTYYYLCVGPVGYKIHREISQL